MTSTLKFDRWQNTSGETIADVSSGGFPGRNLLYNGAMQVAQRGTSSTGITSTGYYTADRWNTSLSGLGTWTQSVEADSPSGSGFANSLKMLCTTADSSPAASDALVVLQRLEGQDVQALKFGTSSAESLTISFWVKSNVTGTYVVRLRNIDAGRHIAASYSVASSGTWEKKTVTFAGDTSGSFTNDNSSALQVDFYLGAGTDYTSGTLPSSWETAVNANNAVGQTNLAASTSNYWQVTGVQLEVGTVATAFEHKPFGVELAECQRYYEKSYNQDTKPGTATSYGGGQGRTLDATQSYAAIQLPFKVTKRTTPTVTLYNPDTGSSSNPIWNSNTGADLVGAAQRAGEFGCFSTVANSSVSATQTIATHFTAEAEL